MFNPFRRRDELHRGAAAPRRQVGVSPRGISASTRKLIGLPDSLFNWILRDGTARVLFRRGRSDKEESQWTFEVRGGIRLLR